jgi:hypothetical protein
MERYEGCARELNNENTAFDREKAVLTLVQISVNLDTLVLVNWISKFSKKMAE